jgi:MFS family permease
VGRHVREPEGRGVASVEGQRMPDLHRDTVSAASGAMLFSFGLGVASVAMPLAMLEAGFSNAAVGLLTAASAVAQMGARLLLVPILRAYSDWLLVMSAAVVLATSLVVVCLSPTLIGFAVAQLLQGVARAFFWTGSQVHVVRGTGPSVRALAHVNFLSSIGMLLGPIAAGLLAERSINHALTAGAAVTIAAVVPACLLDRLPTFERLDNSPPGWLWRRPGVQEGCWAAVTAGAWRALLSSYVPVALAQAGRSSSTVGFLVSSAHAASLVGALVAGRLRWRGLAAAFGLGVLATGLSIAVVALVAEWTFAVAAALIISGLGAGCLQTMGPAIASDAVHPQERGEAIASVGMFRAASSFAAPLVVAGIVTALPISAGLAVIGLAIALPAVRTRALRDHLSSSDDT